MSFDYDRKIESLDMLKSMLVNDPDKQDECLNDIWPSFVRDMLNMQDSSYEELLAELNRQIAMCNKNKNLTEKFGI